MGVTPAGPVRIKFLSHAKSRQKMEMPLNVAKTQMNTKHDVPSNVWIWIVTMLAGTGTRWISITVRAGLTAKVGQIGLLH